MKYFLPSIILWTSFYLAGSFEQATFNIIEWDSGLRGAVAYFSTVMGLLFGGFLYAKDKDE